MTYFDELCRAMELVAQHPRSIFLGQAVAFPGTGMTASFKNVPREKLLEMPVAEEMQLGMSIGMAMDGMLPVSIFPRWNFLLLAMNQLVNHLDKIPLYSSFRPKVIIRVAIGASWPLDPGPQHLGDFSFPVAEILKTVAVYTLVSAAEIVPCYQEVLERDRSVILVEHPEKYNEQI